MLHDFSELQAIYQALNGNLDLREQRNYEIIEGSARVTKKYLLLLMWVEMLKPHPVIHMAFVQIYGRFNNDRGHNALVR